MALRGHFALGGLTPKGNSATLREQPSDGKEITVITWHLIITWPDGSIEQDTATGNTERTANAAKDSLKRSYENDDASVKCVKLTRIS